MIAVPKGSYTAGGRDVADHEHAARAAYDARVAAEKRAASAVG